MAGAYAHQRADLVAYVKTFSSRFKNEKPDPAIPIPAETASTTDSIARGKELYQNTLKCGECHGATGHGDGPSAPTLFDNLGNKLPPYDFTSGLLFKCGETDRDLYRIFLWAWMGRRCLPTPTSSRAIKPGIWSTI